MFLLFRPLLYKNVWPLDHNVSVTTSYFTSEFYEYKRHCNVSTAQKAYFLSKC